MMFLTKCGRHQHLCPTASYLVDLADAVVAIKDEKGKVKLNQIHNLTATGAAAGGYWGVLIGLIFLNPLLGMAAGATAGAIRGALTDVGISNDFMKQVASGFNNGSSALFVLAREVTPDKVLAELEGTGGKILQTSLTHEQETRLQVALDAAKPASDAWPDRFDEASGQ
jgi:uncharacterized membrane protein